MVPFIHSFVNSTHIYGAPTVFRNEVLVLRNLKIWVRKRDQWKGFHQNVISAMLETSTEKGRVAGMA